MKPVRSAVTLSGLAALTLYALTASRTITFWDGAHYPFLATTLSISNPPGSLLLVLLGWLATRWPLVSPPAFQLALVAAATMAATVAMTALASARVVRAAGAGEREAAVAALGAAAWLAPAVTAWTYATQYTPYGLTACFTALLLLLSLRWWERAADRDDLRGLLAVVFVLGLDVSVHRTNLLLAPGLLAGVLLRRPQLFRRALAWGASLGVFALAVSLQGLHIPLAARHPVVQVWPMASFRDVLGYVRLDPLGGGFLVNLWPRHADFVHVQLADWWHVVASNLGATRGVQWAVGACAAAGLVALARREPRRAAFVASLFLAAGLGAVVYFNRPLEYMRPLDRHYLPSVVLLAVFVGAGLAGINGGLEARARGPRTVLALALALALAAAGIALRWSACDRSHTRFAERLGRDLLEPLPPSAVLLTNGDNDTFPPLYLQAAEQVRPDVLVLNVSMLYAPAYRALLAAREPRLAALSESQNMIRQVVSAYSGVRPVYAAVTVAPDWFETPSPYRLPEGLTSRLDPAPDSLAATAALARFVRERVPRCGLADRRQYLEPDFAGMLSNYDFAVSAYMRFQWEAGDSTGALATLDAAERDLPLDRLGKVGEAQRRFREQLRRGLAGQRAARSR